MTELALNFETKISIDGAPLETLKRFLPEAAQNDLPTDDASKKLIAARLSNVSAGLAGAVPMQCQGASCTFSSTCPLIQTGMNFSNMMGQLCPIEKYYMQQWSVQLASELKLDTDQIVDKWAAMDIIKWMILEHRALSLLEKYPDVVKMQVVGLTKDGDPVEQEQINILISFIDQCEKAIQRSLKTLNATREAKARSKESDAKLAAVMASLRDKIQGMSATTTINLNDS